jgi:hypothetical protein
MQYHLTPTAVNATALTAAVPRIVDAHSPLHQRATKSAKACDAADVVDGLAVLQNPTLRLAAAAYGVSLGSVARARRLTPEQRQAVRQGKRPLVLPRKSPALPALPMPTVVPATPSISPVTMNVRERLKEIVREIGFEATLNLLAATEKVAA